LKVQYNDMRVSHNSGNDDASFEMRIFETARVNTTVPNGSGRIDFIYGSMRNSGNAITGGNIGIGYSGAPGTNDFLSVDISNHTASTTATNNTYPNGNITRLNNGRRYRFTPPLVAGQEVDLRASCLSSTSIILNWTDNATNEVGIVLYRSVNGGSYIFDRQLPANTTNVTITGLNPSTDYSYQVYAVTEGKLSALAPTGTVNLTTLPATVNAVYSIISNNWTNINTWTTTAVPVITSDVIIGCIDPHTVQVNDNGVANTLLVETGSILNFNATNSLTVEGNTTNNGTINLNGGTLRIKGNLINEAGATVNIGNGTLIVEGNFQNAATATLNGNTGLFRLRGNFTNQGAYNPNTSTMRFDGAGQQLINHTGTSSGQGTTTVSNSYNNNTALVTPGTPAIPGTPIAIPDNNATGVSQTLNFPATAETITNVTLNLQINHTWVGDLRVRLTSPDGTTRTLINRPGRVFFGLGCSGDNINVLLSDAAASDVEDQCAAGTPTINGTFRPNESLAIGVTSFLGENPSGNWTITVSDLASLSTGSLVSGSLNVTTASGTTSVLVNPGTPAVPATPGLSIPDNSNAGVSHTINVPTTGTIQSVRMDIAIDHTLIGDLRITLTSPNGTTRRMMNRLAGGGAAGDCAGQNLSIMFDDLAAANVQSQCGAGVPSINGTYQPNQSLSNFVGEEQQGDWIITVSDRNGGEIGRIMSANLYITTSQIVTFPPNADLYFYNLLMQNTGSEVRTQNTDIWITNNATWTNGVFRADNNHKLIFPDNATSTVAINASHADMLVRKIGNDAFNFPVGNAGWGAPIGISAPATVTDHFTANYVRQVTPNDPFSKEASIHHVGQCEYWILDRTNGASNVVVTLSYDDVRSCTVGTETGLKVVRWDGSIWRDHFHGGLIAAPYTGVFSLGTVNNFSPFTLGATFDDNILPLTFLSFDAKPLENDAILDWTTTGELNHDYFEIERSFTGDNFKGIGNVKNPITRNNTKNTYSFIDKNVGIENREAYYRLKQIDTDGNFSYSDIKKVNWSINNSENQAVFVAYPNPFTAILTLEFEVNNQENMEITLMDMAGRRIKTISQSFSKGNNKLELNNLKNLAQGSYLVQLKSNTLLKTFKVVKM